MKYLALLAFSVTIAFGQSTWGTVYIMPMAGGLDQYLAACLTRDRVMQVVADPKIADIVLTDRLGEAFEQKMAEIHPKDDKKTDPNSHPAFRTTTARGTVFLVHVKSRQVIWSDYENFPASSSGSNLNQVAERIVKKLQTSNR